MTKEMIKNLSYTDFISLIEEENRPSGGKKTIREIAINSFINSNSKILEIGCTNGFSSIEINRLVNCSVVGIDINNESIKNANKKITLYGLDKDKIKFINANAENLPFENEEFDLIIFGNALSFIKNKEKTIEECKRVLKKDGFISLVPIWYKQEVNKKIVKKVNEILGFEISCTFNKDWESIDKFGLELYYKKDYTFIKQNKDEIQKYVDTMIDTKKNINNFNQEVKKAIKKRWFNTINVFNDNLEQCNYSVILLRKNLIKEELEIIKTNS